MVLLLLLVTQSLTVSCSVKTVTQSIVMLPSPTSDNILLTILPTSPTDTSLPSTGTPIPSQETVTAIRPTSSAEPLFVIERIFPKDGDLTTQLAAEVKKAKGLGFTPIAEFDAAW